jgi:SagB-type dehydrogenase family enzyme
MGSLLLTRAGVRLGWRPDVTVTDDGDAVVVAGPNRAARVQRAAVGRAVLERLAAPDGSPLHELVAADEVSAPAADPSAALMAALAARSLLIALAARGLLSARLVDDDGVAATIAVPALPDEPVARPDVLVLSDDVLLRRAEALAGPAGRGLVLESAADPTRCDPISARFAAALGAMAEPRAVGDTYADAPLPASWLDVLVAAGILISARDGAPLDARERWEFHDRLFHTRSRLWFGPVRPFGTTMRLAGVITPLPAQHVPSTASGPPIALAVPDLDRTGSVEPSFTAVAETRRSRRRPSGPLAVDALASLLYRVARVRAVHATTVGGELDRPAPSGGGIAAISVYPLVVACEGLDPGLYHYDGVGHVLRALSAAPSDALARLTSDARQTAMLEPDAPLQVLLLLAARFGRLQYKYSAMSYAAVLKDVGVLYQSLYLTATVLGLGGCAMGAGDALAFEQASGLDRWEEGSVGEFLVVGGPGIAERGGVHVD